MHARGLLAVSVALVIAALAVVPTPASAEKPYKWKLVCHGSPTFSATASWHWTVNGTAVPGSDMTASCTDSDTVQGNGTRPADANDFEVTLSIAESGGLPKSVTFTDTFDAGHHFHARFGLTFADPENAVFAVNSWPA